MAAYTKEFLIDVYMFRFRFFAREVRLELEENAERCYDTYGRDAFRTYASVDAEQVKYYKEMN